MKEFIIFTKEILDQLHFSKLREIGRQIGVKAPAGKKKNQLITEIMAVQQNKIKPIPISKRGAPPKITIDVSEFYKQEQPNKDGNQPDMSKECSYEGSEVLHTTFSDSKPKDKEFTIEGVLEQHSQGYGFFCSHVWM